MSRTAIRSVESAAVGVLVAIAAAAWFQFPAADEVCGGGGATWAWTIASGGSAGPLGWAGAAFAAVLGDGWGWLATFASALGAGAAVVWALVRRAGADRLAALLAVCIATFVPVLARDAAGGGLQLLFVPFSALALGLLPSSAVGSRLLGFAALLTVAWCDARAGLVLGLAAAFAGGGPLAVLGALAAGGSPAVASATQGVVDPVDLAAPFVQLRADAVAPGLAALAGAVWFAPDKALRRAALVAFVFSLGPVLSAFGDPLTVGVSAVPLPAVLGTILLPEGAGWTGALMVAAVASALALAHAPRVAWVLAPVAIFESAAVAARPECVALAVPVGILGLSERSGGVLDLPVAVEVDGQVAGAPSAAHALYRWQAVQHGRAPATTVEPIGTSDPLLGEPAVILSLNAATGAGRFLMPPTRPGDVLRGLGVTEIVVHRGFYAPAALAVLDPILLKLYGAPQRDHAGGIDLYRVSSTGSARPPTDESLHPAGRPGPKGWLDASAWLAGFEPAGVGREAAPTATPEGARRPKGPPKEGGGRKRKGAVEGG